MTAALIAGGGIAGLALACGLAERGVASTVLEAAADPQPIGAGLQLGPNAARALAALKLDIPPGTIAPQRLVVRGGRGQVLLEKPLGEAFRRRYGAPYLVTHRGALWAALRARAEAQSAIDLIDGRAIDHARISDGTVEVTAGGETCRPAVLIGADGLRSRVREALVGPAPLREHGLEAWRTLVPAERVPAALRQPDVTLTFAPRGGHSVSYPVEDGARINLVVIRPGGHDAEAGWSREGDADTLLSAFAGAPPPPLAALIAAAPGWTRWPLLDRDPTAHWGHGDTAPTGPATLIGDAAHPALPFLAQGAAMALEDAAALAEPLADALTSGQDPAPILRAFEESRQARAAHLVRASRSVGRTYHMPPPFSIARDLALRAMGARLTDRYDWIYRA